MCEGGDDVGTARLFACYTYLINSFQLKIYNFIQIPNGCLMFSLHKHYCVATQKWVGEFCLFRYTHTTHKVDNGCVYHPGRQISQLGPIYIPSGSIQAYLYLLRENIRKISQPTIYHPSTPLLPNPVYHIPETREDIDVQELYCAVVNWPN